jgi:hypothetical protein
MRWLTLCLVLMVGFAGCNSVERPAWMGGSASGSAGVLPPPDEPQAVSAPQQGLALSSTQRFADVPLPVGLSEDADRTFVYESGSLMMGRMVYTTRASVAELAQFYIDAAPAANWKMTNIIQTGDAEINFTKPGRKLVVKAQDLGRIKGRRLSLTYTPDGGQ